MLPCLLLLLLSSGGCGGEVLGDGGVAGQWFLHLTKTATCEPGGPQEYLAVAHVEPVEADERHCFIRFGNQEWIISVGPGGEFAEWQGGIAVTKLFSGRFDGDDLRGELAFEPAGDECRNAYRVTGQKVLDYPTPG